MEALGTLAGGIAHDFNNHLAVMLGNARFVRQEVEAEPEVLAAIDDFERSADHCAQLTRSLLAFSRRTPVQIMPVEVADLVEGVEELVRPLLPSTILFETRLMPDLGSFSVDRVQIQQVLVNLLVNARDAMPEGGPIRLNAERRSISEAEATAEGLDGFRKYVVLSVEDAGHGMDAETRSRVFEPFFTTKGVGHGTGLGLAMAYGIVRQSDGRIAVESRPGGGSTFRVYLPSVEVAYDNAPR
jgi:signal transduction histidine kinase